MYRDCDCGHTHDHHSQKPPCRCLECNCKEYNPLGVERQVIEKSPLEEIQQTENYFYENEFEHKKPVIYVVKKPNSVIATCHDKENAERITNLLNFADKIELLRTHEKEILSPLLTKAGECD